MPIVTETSNETLIEVNKGEVMGQIPKEAIVEQEGKTFVDMDKLFEIVEKGRDRNVFFSFSDVSGNGHSVSWSEESK